MSDIDSDFSPDGSADEGKTTENVDNSNSESLGRRSSRLSDGVQVTYNHTTKKRRASVPTDLEEIALVKTQVSKRLRGLDIDENLSLRIIKATLELQEDYLRQKQKRGKAKAHTVKPARLRENICKTFGISNVTYDKIISSYFSEDPQKRVVYASGKDGTGRTGNRKEKDTRIARTTECRLLVQRLVREKRAKKERVTARQVMDCLLENGLLSIPMDEQTGCYRKKEFASAIRNVQRLLGTFGFQRGQRTGNLILDQEVTLKLHHYLNTLIQNRNAPPDRRRREVMVDESYIYEHYHRSDESMWDPNDEQDLQITMDPEKGRQCCFVAAIQGPDPRVATGQGEVAMAEMAGLVPGSVWTFCPQEKGVHSGDFDKGFHGDNFLKWWTTHLLPNLHQSSLIILDTAKYHMVYDKDVPVLSSTTKAALQEYLARKGVNVDPLVTGIMLRHMAKEWIRENEKPAIVKLAEELGHKVLFTPPHHADLEPIKLVCSHIKGIVGRQYVKSRTLEMVQKRLMQEFTKLDDRSSREAIQKMIDQCSTLALEMYEEIQNDDEEDDYGLDDVQLDPWQQQPDQGDSDDDKGDDEMVAD